MSWVDRRVWVQDAFKGHVSISGGLGEFPLPLLTARRFLPGEITDFNVTGFTERGKMSRQRIRHDIAALRERLKAVERFPDDDPFDDGAVIVFDKTMFNEQIYNYAAIRAAGLWYTTGPKSPKGYEWSELVDFLSVGVEKVYFAATATEVFPA